MVTYEHPRPAVTVDCVVFGFDENDLKVLLIQRKYEPFRGVWALPGGFVHLEENLEQAAARELWEETGIKGCFLEQLYTFGRPDRDPRDRVITVAYYALINLNDYPVQADSDAIRVAWFAMDDIPKLAFDHEEILKTAQQRLKGKITYQPIGFELLPDKFTLTQLQRLYEIILATGLDKRNFRRKLLAMGFLEETNEIQTDVAHRAARLYRFNKVRYEQVRQNGFNFEL
ncbi:MAG: NUDIX hydrolase [Desulfobacteraceae bacterium]|nr:MAG: NUDIX hydrolase [Desulfobacteraceae bacterium]